MQISQESQIDRDSQSLRRSRRRSFTSTTSLSTRDPNLPIPSLLGPTPPPRPPVIRPAASHTGYLYLHKTSVRLLYWNN
jgi:hypothetical protein